MGVEYICDLAIYLSDSNMLVLKKADSMDKFETMLKIENIVTVYVKEAPIIGKSPEVLISGNTKNVSIEPPSGFVLRVTVESDDGKNHVFIRLAKRGKAYKIYMNKIDTYNIGICKICKQKTPTVKVSAVIENNPTEFRICYNCINHLFDDEEDEEEW